MIAGILSFTQYAVGSKKREAAKNDRRVFYEREMKKIANLFNEFPPIVAKEVAYHNHYIQQKEEAKKRNATLSYWLEEDRQLRLRHEQARHNQREDNIRSKTTLPQTVEDEEDAKILGLLNDQFLSAQQQPSIFSEEEEDAMLSELLAAITPVLSITAPPDTAPPDNQEICSAANSSQSPRLFAASSTRQEKQQEPSALKQQGCFTAAAV